MGWLPADCCTGRLSCLPSSPRDRVLAGVPCVRLSLRTLDFLVSNENTGIANDAPQPLRSLLGGVGRSRVVIHQAWPVGQLEEGGLPSLPGWPHEEEGTVGVRVRDE